MKYLQAILVLAILMVAGCGTTRQTAAERERTMQTIQQMLDARTYKIDITYMIPLRGGAKAVSSYSISVDGSTIDSHLPYLGEARNLPYGGGKGLTFKGKIDGYSDSGWKKDARSIVISVKNEEDTYIYTIDVFDNGSADVRVHCRNRDDISYRGTFLTE